VKSQNVFKRMTACLVMSANFEAQDDVEGDERKGERKELQGREI
jgi:hypothetical protein